MRPLAALLIVFTFFSCNRDPKVVSRKYLENGTKYYDRGKYKEARIMYLNALKKDALNGEAYYQLALTYLKLGQVPDAVRPLRRAVELIKSGPHLADAKIKLADIYVIAAQTNSKDRTWLEDARRFARDFLAQDPNSFDGYRLMGDVDTVQAMQNARERDAEGAKKMLREAIAEYRKAQAIKPANPGVMLALARTLAADGQFPEAESLYKAVLRQNKTAVPVYQQLTGLYMRHNRPEDAENTLKSAIANNPKNLELLTQLAAFYYSRNRRGEMAKTLDTLKSHAREYDRAHMIAGDFYLRLGNVNDAIREYRAGVTDNPKRKADYQKRVIEALLRDGRKDEAAQVNAEILKENPRDPDARGMAAGQLLEKGDVAKALTELQATVAAKPDNFVARYNLGRAHLARGQSEQARQEFNQVIALRPDYIPARLALVQLQLARRDYDAALKSTQEILTSWDSSNGRALLMRSMALMGLKRNAEAREVLQALLKGNPKNPDVLYQFAVLNLLEARYKDAEELFRQCYAAQPQNLRGLMGVVDTYAAQKKLEQAVPVLEAEIQKNPKRPDIRIAAANLDNRVGMHDRALEHYQAVLGMLDKKNPKTLASLYVLIADTYRNKKDYDRGLEAAKKAVELNPTSAAVLDSKALLLERAGRPAEARKLYDQSIKLEPENPITLNNLAYLMAETGDNLDLALTYAQKAKQRMPAMQEVSDTLGWIYLKKNLSDNALQIFQTLVEQSPQNSAFRYHLGLAFYQKGDKAKALKEARTALEQKPSREEEAKIRELIAKASS